jgi:hypothetical protein
LIDIYNLYLKHTTGMNVHQPYVEMAENVFAIRMVSLDAFVQLTLTDDNVSLYIFVVIILAKNGVLKYPLNMGLTCVSVKLIFTV